MPPSDSTVPPTTPAIARHARAGGNSRGDRALRSSAFTVVLLILVQYALGMWVNLFATIPTSDHGKSAFAAFGAAVAHGPVGLSLHALVGTLLLLSAIGFFVQAVLARTPVVLVLGGIGLLAIIGAWVNGALFVGNQANGSSFGMAMSAAVALLCYVTVLFLLPPGRRAPAT